MATPFILDLAPHGARLRRLRIEHFRGIDQLDLDFGGSGDQPIDLAVLAGDNGCGKTAVLEAILLLMGEERFLSIDRGTRAAQVEFGSQDFRIEGVLEIRELQGAQTVLRRVVWE